MGGKIHFTGKKLAGLAGNRKAEAALAIGFLLVYEFLCYRLLLVKYPLKGDENHFYRTAVSFSRDFSIRHILHYNELVTPLTFLIYGFWGKFFGTDPAIMRLPSLFVGFFTHLLFFLFLRNYFTSKTSWLLFFIWVSNPYNIGFSSFIFTDTLSNLWIVIFLIYFARQNKLMLIVSSVLLVYTRQYNVILIAAGILAAMASPATIIKNKKNISLCLAAGMCSIVPLFLAWRGFSPLGTMTGKLHRVSRFFYPEALSAYVYCIFVYTLPASLILLKKIRWSKYRLIVTASAALLFYAAFPVEASYIAKKDGFLTVGIFDKFLTSLLPDNIRHALLFLCFLCGTIMVAEFIRLSLKLKQSGQSLIVNLSVANTLFFLAAMVFNFQIWEKYFIQILPCILFLVGVLLERTGYPCQSWRITSKDLGMRKSE